MKLIKKTMTDKLTQLEEDAEQTEMSEGDRADFDRQFQLIKDCNKDPYHRSRTEINDLMMEMRKKLLRIQYS